ncbi:MAG: hypothetical protein JWN08_1671 [Frankiales bacterium]|nr:hypothetical protein [Frankiales bacterium]
MSRQRVSSALRAVLPAGAALEVQQESTFIEVHIAGARVAAVWLDAGTAAAVRQARAEAPQVKLVVAPRFSAGALSAVREAGLGWVDEFGGAEFAFDGVVVSRTGLPATKRRARGWTPATLGVAEALLTGTRGTVSALRERLHVSPNTVAVALQTLTDAGLLTATAARGRNSGRSISEPAALLEAYAQAAADLHMQQSLTVGALWRDPVADLANFGARLDDASLTWAATGALAAAVQAPYQTQVAPWVVYVRSTTVADLLYAASIVGLEPINGGRLELRAFPSPSTERLTERLDGVCVVPWPRSYADLRWTGVRGEGAADHLAEVMMKAQLV